MQTPQPNQNIPQLISIFGKGPALAAALLILIGGCTSSHTGPQTLADLDVRSSIDIPTAQTPVHREVNIDQAKAAYYEFVHAASSADPSRNLALTRLADIELRESLRQTDREDYQDDQRYRAPLQRTTELLDTALEEFPNAPGNDRKLYQLARSLDQLGDYDDSLAALQRLTNQYPSSNLYAEAQFRLAEAAFSRGDYLAAEINYTAALHSSHDTAIHERTLFKRGWARYKQSMFGPALQDFVTVTHSQQFPSLFEQRVSPLPQSQQVIYNEYYRSLALSMLHYSGSDSVVSLLRQHGVANLYAPFFATSQILITQGRTSDAVVQWQTLLDAEPDLWTQLNAQAQIAKLWFDAGFYQQALSVTESLYQHYRENHSALVSDQQPAAQYARTLLRSHWLKSAQYYHTQYQQQGGREYFEQARNWYQRYLKQFDSYAHQDGVILAFGDLLAEAEETETAYQQYERAAFEGNIILNPEAAYAALALLDEMTAQTPVDWLADYTRYASAYARLYPNDPHALTMILNVARHQFSQGDNAQALTMAELALVSSEHRQEALRIILQCQLRSAYPEQAEGTANRLLALPDIDAEITRETREQRALAVYQQAEAAEASEQWAQAIHHYRRIHEQDPSADNAPNGLYNAIVLASEQEQWGTVLNLIEQFAAVYPEHPRYADTQRRLSQAYLASGQTDAAARQYERLANAEQDATAQRAAQWQAAELYLERRDTKAAINAFRRYAHRYPSPWPQNAEAMNHLIALYAETGEISKRQFWERKLINEHRQRNEQTHTARTRRLAANASINLARSHHADFSKTALRLPLDKSLARKTEQMQNAIQYYARASAFGFADITSEATFHIGRLYETLASDLLSSERPSELSDNARLQYDILLEDRAFPFEDKAIELYERNLRRAREGGYDQWHQASRKRLTQLFPVRYARPPKADFHLQTFRALPEDEKS